MENERRRKFIAVALSLIVVGAAFFLGIGVGYANRPSVEKVVNVIRPETNRPAEVNFSQFWDVWRLVESKYVDRDKIDRKKLVDGAIAGMVKAVGDPYTVFLTKDEARRFESDIQGSFEGIGAEIGLRKGTITIIAPLRGSPAERAGLHAGDKILKIDDAFTADITVDEAVKLIRGKGGTKVRLTIFRDTENAPREVAITREKIVIPNIRTEQKPDGIFVIQLNQFSRPAPGDFESAVKEFQKSGSAKLIFDLRNNPGGYLDAAISIASWFIPSGHPILTERWNDGREEVYRSKGYRALERTPVVVLVNQGSASASEIVAGALHDDRQIQLIGEKTFGKGLVQELENLPGGASLKVTVAKWLTPSGKSINQSGLEPDIKVEMGTSTAPEEDPVIKKAIEVLRRK